MMLAGCVAAHHDVGLAALAKPGDRNVTVAAIPSADLAGLYVAQDEGLFARQGLRVTIKTIASTKAVIASQLNGQVDIGAGSYVGAGSQLFGHRGDPGSSLRTIFGSWAKRRAPSAAG